MSAPAPLNLALQEADVVLLERRLAAAAPHEEGAFFLLREGRGAEGQRLLAGEMLPSPPGAWERQGPGELRPSARHLSAMISAAASAGCGLLFVHSHPDAGHPIGFSPIDVSSLRDLAATICPLLEGPFAAAVVHEVGWGGALVGSAELKPIRSIASVGQGLRFLSPPPARSRDEEALDSRQRDALGAAHERLRSLSVAVVGTGGLGSPLAEQLVRMGVAKLILLDDDVLDTESNARRVFGTGRSDVVGASPAPKAEVVAAHLRGLGLGTEVAAVVGDVTREAAFRHLLDVDLVFGATDTHASRAVLNDLPSTYLLPVLDLGVRVGNRADGALAGLVAEVRLLTPERPCLWCRGLLDPDAIRAENLPATERRALQREGYLANSIGAPVPSVAALTVMGSGMGACTLLGLLAGEEEELPSGWIVDGLLGDAFESGQGLPDLDCRCRAQLARGDDSPPPLR